MPHRFSGPSLAGLISSLVLASPAGAITVNVQLEGDTVVQLATPVTTTAAVTRDGQECFGDSGVAALDVLTAGDWKGNYTADGASFDGPTSPGIIKGESHLFSSGTYWAMYVNGLYIDGFPCQYSVKDGDEVLWFKQEDVFVAGFLPYSEPLYMTGVPSIAKPGVPFTVKVQQSFTEFNANFTLKTARLDSAEGATVAGATVGADGNASITLTQRGSQPIVATKGTYAPDRGTVCVTDGQDGFCGSEIAKAAAAAEVQATCATTGDDGRCGSPDKRPSYGFITSLREQQRFAKGKGPRELKGRMDADPSGVKNVQLRLTRTDGRRCSTFDAAKQQLVAMPRCGAARGKLFSAGDKGDWTYLLPEALPRGRYVLDVLAIDGAGNTDTTLHRGRNRIVFHVA